MNWSLFLPATLASCHHHKKKYRDCSLNQFLNLMILLLTLHIMYKCQENKFNASPYDLCGCTFYNDIDVSY